MAEVTKRKIASIYSLVVGFVLSAFSGHAQSGEFTNFFKQPSTIKNTKTTTTNTAPSTTRAGMLYAPAPVQTGGDAALLQAPAPVQSTSDAGLLQAPAPATVVGSTTTLITNAYELKNTEERGFIIREATGRGLDPTRLNGEEMTVLRIEYLQNKVNELENSLHQLQEGQGN